MGLFAGFSGIKFIKKNRLLRIRCRLLLLLAQALQLIVDLLRCPDAVGRLRLRRVCGCCRGYGRGCRLGLVRSGLLRSGLGFSWFRVRDIVAFG